MILVCAVNSYGDDREVSSSSDSEDELAKQFEISVSRSQSFRSGVMELNTQDAPGQQHKFKRLLSDQEEGSTEPSDCEGTHTHIHTVHTECSCTQIFIYEHEYL